MIHHILIAIAVSLFWASFALIGFAAWLRTGASDSRGRLLALHRFVDDCPWPVQLLIFFAFGMALMVPAALLAYALSVPTGALATFYVGLLVLALYVVLTHWRWVAECLRGAWQWSRSSWLATGLFVGMLLALGGFGTMAGAYMAEGTDSFVHMAKIMQIADGHPTFADPFFNGGVQETRYHLNILYVLYAVIAQLLSVPAYEVWRASLAFFLVAAGLSVFATAWYFLPRAWQRSWPQIIAVLSMLMTMRFWYNANYPNQVVLLWFVLFIIGLMRYLRNREPLLLVVSVALIALTHASYALMALGFTVLLVVGLMLFDRPSLRAIGGRGALVLSACMLVLALPSAITFMFPDRMTEFSFTLGGANEALKLVSVGPFEILNPQFMYVRGLEWITAVAAAAIGYAWVIWKSPGRLEKIFVGALVLFYGLIAFNPIFFALFADTVPTWLVQRFSYFNRLGVVAPAIGFVVVAVWILRRVVTARLLPLVVFTAGCALVLLPATTQAQYADLLAGIRASNRQMVVLRAMDELKPAMQNQTIIATLGDGFVVPSAMPVESVIWMPESNASPMADMTRRKACARTLLHGLELRDLRAAHVTRVLTVNNAGLQDIAAEKPYLRRIASSGDFNVWAVEYPPGVSSRGGACAIPYSS
jgi:hypothetical protein